MASKLLILFLGGLWVAVESQQYSPYSLQSAVDALHRREAQLALIDNYEQQQQQQQQQLHPSHYPNNDGYLNDGERTISDLTTPYRGSRQQLNKLLANYLAREEDERDSNINAVDYEDEYDPDERKRSIFRERDEFPYQSVFRERELDTPDLTEDFLKEIDRQRNMEREEKYKDTLRRLWEKYQQQENDIERELFEEERKRSEEGYYKKKRSYSNDVVPLGFLGPVEMPQKRILPVLPWLPASRRKRFPVSKRSPPKYTNDDVNVSGTNQKVTKDLQAIFGEPIEEKTKRSSEPVKSKIKQVNEHRIEKKSDHAHHDDQDDSDEHDEHEHDHDHERDEEEEDDHDFDDSDEYVDTKKKRAITKRRSNLEVVKEDQIIPGDLTNFKKKKSIQWSKYFGMDRRKKSAGSDWYMHKYKNVMKRPSDGYPLHNFKQYNELDERKNLSEDKLNNMDLKLKTIEDLIIDETVKYTGAHEGITDLDDIKKLKDHVVSRLATAYSLEKMRRALEKLKQSVDDEQHLQKNEIESSNNNNNESENDKIDVDKEKRVAIKKEKAEFDNKNHKIETVTEKVIQHEVDNGLTIEDEKTKKKKAKRGGYPDIDFEEELGAGHFEPMNDVYMDRKGLVENGRDCPLLDAIDKRCRGVDLLSGDIHQELLTICNVHQLCYLCGSKQAACDFQYLSEADAICQNEQCLHVARSALMILRDTNMQMGARGCSKNPCFEFENQAMREIGL